MYRQVLQPLEDSTEAAAAWARHIALAKRPELADAVAEVAHDLVSQALRRTPLTDRIHLLIDLPGDGLKIEVRDAGHRDSMGGWEFAEMSTHTMSFGTCHDGNGHWAWAELRTDAVVSA
jgi:hypothetical protein